MASVPNKKMRGRAVFIAAILTLLGFGLVIFQLYRVQLVEGEAYKQEAMSRQLRATTISANRGPSIPPTGRCWRPPQPHGGWFSPRRISPRRRRSCWPTA